MASKIWGFGSLSVDGARLTPPVKSLLLGLQPGDPAGVYFLGGGGFCPHQCPQRMLSASSPHSWSLSLSTLTPWRSHPSAEIAWIDTSRPPPAVAQRGRGSGRLLSPKRSSPLLPCLRDSLWVPSSLSVKSNGWQPPPFPVLRPKPQSQPCLYSPVPCGSLQEAHWTLFQNRSRI